MSVPGDQRADTAAAHGQDISAAMQELGWGNMDKKQTNADIPAVKTEGQHEQPAQPAAVDMNNGSASSGLQQGSTVAPLTTENLLKMQAEQGVPSKSYTRRAAANLIQRLRDSPDRLMGLPKSLQDMVNSESKKSELISILCDAGGALDEVAVSFQVYEDKYRAEMNRKSAVRLTRKQMVDTYGEEAEKVMAFKEKEGLTEADENCPGAVVYIVAQRSDETECGTKSGILAVSMSCILQFLYLCLIYMCKARKDVWDLGV